MGAFAKFYVRQKSCYDFSYQQMQANMEALLNQISLYKLKEEQDKQYELNLFKNNTKYDQALTAYD